MEKAIVVVLDLAKTIKKRTEASTEAVDELNQHLRDGWRVKQVAPTSGTDHFMSASLVILERDD